MSFSNWLTASALALLPMAAFAQQAQPPLAPTSPNAPVSTPQYESAFANYLATPQADVTPDKVWRAANEEVLRQGGHGGHAMAPASENSKQPMHSMPGMGTSQPESGSGSAEPADHSSHHGGH